MRRALARRFPATRRAWNSLRASASGFFSRLRFRRARRSAVWARGVVTALMRRRREKRLTVGVEVASFWEPLTGIGWYLYRLLEHLADRDDLRLRLYGPSVVVTPDLPAPVVDLPAGRAIETVRYEVPEDFILPAGWIMRALRRLEPVLIAADRNQVLFAPNYFLPRRFRLAGGARVATVHDLGFRRFPWTLRRQTLAELEETFGHAVHEASRLISVSAAVRDELVADGFADARRVRVVHHGPGQLSTVEPSELPPGLPERFGLFVGTIEPRKNLATLLAAWRVLRARDPASPALVLCGRFGWKSHSLRAEVELAKDEGWAHHLGYVEDPALAALFQAAQVVVFPSIYEGFGLPAVEALWAGTPLVASDIPVLREVTRDAALFAPYDDPAALAGEIHRALTDQDLRRELIARGKRRVEEMSWTQAADQTAAVWYEAAGRQPPPPPSSAHAAATV